MEGEVVMAGGKVRRAPVLSWLGVGICIAVLVVMGMGCSGAEDGQPDEANSSQQEDVAVTGDTGTEEEMDVVTLKVVAAWPLQSDQDFLYHEYIDTVNVAAEKQGIPVRLEKTGGPEVVQATQLFEAMGSGTIDMAYTSVDYYTGIVPEMGVLDSIKPDREQYKQALAEADVMDELNGIMEEKAQVRMLGLALAVRGFKLLSTKPVDGTDWGGLKVRAIGTPSARGIEAMGGSPVTIPSTEVLTSLEQGVVDAVIGTAMDRIGLGERDVYKYITLPPFTESASGFFIGSDTWDDLSEETKTFLDSESKAFQEWQYGWCEEKEQAAIDKYVEEDGVEIIEFTKEEQEKLGKAFRTGYLDYIVEESPAYGPQLKELVEPYVF